MKQLLPLLISFCIAQKVTAQSYKTDYTKDGFTGYVQFEIVKDNYTFGEPTFKMRDNVVNVITGYKNGAYDAVLRKAGITFPKTLRVTTANNTVDVRATAFFYKSPAKRTLHQSQPSVRLSLYDPITSAPDFSTDAVDYLKQYGKEQGVSLWKATGGLKDFEVTFVMLVDIKNEVEKAIREYEAEEKQTVQKTRESNISALGNNNNKAATQNKRVYEGGKPGSPTSGSTGNLTVNTTRKEDEDLTGKTEWEKAKTKADRMTAARRAQEQRNKELGTQIGESAAALASMVPKTTYSINDFYIGYDIGSKYEALRIGIQGRSMKSDNFYTTLGASFISASFDYQYSVDEEKNKNGKYSFYKGKDESALGGEIYFGLGVNAPIEKGEKEIFFGSDVFFQGLFLDKKTGLTTKQKERENTLGFYGFKLNAGFRTTRVTLRAHYSFNYFVDKKNVFGNIDNPNEQTNFGQLQLQIGYTWEGG